jgi:hypothetical protein
MQGRSVRPNCTVVATREDAALPLPRLAVRVRITELRGGRALDGPMSRRARRSLVDRIPARTAALLDADSRARDGDLRAALRRRLQETVERVAREGRMMTQ